MNAILRGTVLRAALVALALAPARLLAVEGGGGAMVVVADSRRYTGWAAWWINLYNESHVYFALVTILLIPSLALVLGKLTSWLLVRIGINLKSRELAEH
jgi:hypothetical protein